MLQTDCCAIKNAPLVSLNAQTPTRFVREVYRTGKLIMFAMHISALILLATSVLSLEAQEVAEVFRTHCAECHAPGSESPRALRKWPFALDLTATAENSELTGEGNLESSLILSVLEAEEMPPPGSGFAPLEAGEIAIVRTWLDSLAGIPKSESEALTVAELGPDNGQVPLAPESVETRSPVPPKVAKTLSLLQKLGTWIGRFHPLVVHFPVALLSLAAVGAVASRIGLRENFEFTARVLLFSGALTGVASATLGWILADHGRYPADELGIHRLLGTTTAAVACVASLWVLRAPKRLLLACLLLAILVAGTGHTGGVLSLGGDWLHWPK